MTTSREVEWNLVAALRADAASVTVDDSRFDPAWSPSGESFARATIPVPVPGQPGGPAGTGPGVGPGVDWRRAQEPARRPGRARRLAAAAAVVLLAGGAALVTQDDAPTEPGTAMATAPFVAHAQAAPGQVLAPTWVPEGMERTALHWGDELEAAGRATGPAGNDAGRAQLFTDPDDGAARLLVETGPAVEGAEPRGDPTTVRGHDGWAYAVEPSGNGPPPEEGEMLWEGPGGHVRASYRGMGLEEALATVDDLVPRDADDPTAGFDAGADGPLTQAAESAAPPASPPSHLRAEYASPTGRSLPQLIVRTGGPAGGLTPGYVATWFAGERDADGVVSYRYEGDPDAADGYWGAVQLTTVRPDGSWSDVRVDGIAMDTDPNPPFDRFDVAPVVVAAERVMAGLAGFTPDELAAQDQDDTDRMGSAPVVATVTLPSGVVRLHGEDGVPNVACLEVGDVTGCGRVVGAGYDPTGGWYAVDLGDGPFQLVASSVGTPVAMGWDPAAGAPSPLRGEERGEDGDWEVLLLRPDGPVRAEELFPDDAEAIGYCIRQVEGSDPARGEELRQAGLSGQAGYDTCLPEQFAAERDPDWRPVSGPDL